MSDSDLITQRCDNDLFDYIDCALKLIGISTVNTGKFELVIGELILLSSIS